MQYTGGNRMRLGQISKNRRTLRTGVTFPLCHLISAQQEADRTGVIFLVVMATMRHGVSVHGLANILSSYALDLGLATKEDPRLLVDHSKVTREQER